MEPRLRGCNLKARRACQRIAGGERSVTPSTNYHQLLHPEGVTEFINKRSRCVISEFFIDDNVFGIKMLS